MTKSIPHIQQIIERTAEALQGEVSYTHELLTYTPAAPYPHFIVNLIDSQIVESVLLVELSVTVLLPDAMAKATTFDNHVTTQSVLIGLYNAFQSEGYAFDQIVITPVALRQPCVSGSEGSFLFKLPLPSLCPIA